MFAAATGVARAMRLNGRRARVLNQGVRARDTIEGTRRAVRGVARDLPYLGAHRCYKLVDLAFVKVVTVAQRRGVGLPSKEVVIWLKLRYVQISMGKRLVCLQEPWRKARVVHELPKRQDDQAAHACVFDECLEHAMSEVCAGHMVHEAKGDRQVAEGAFRAFRVARDEGIQDVALAEAACDAVVLTMLCQAAQLSTA